MRTFIAAALLMAWLPAAAQVTWSPSAGGTYAPLDGATVQGSMNVRLAGCAAGPWAFSVDGVAANVEKTCPYDLIGDDDLFDTKTLTNGSHAITASGPTSTLTAQFTVANSTTPAWTGTITLSWKPPILNTDGSTLTDLAGFRIKHGTQANSLGDVTTLSNPVLTQYAMGNLPAGAHYFAMTAFNASGAESDESPVASKTLTEPTTPPPPVCPAQPAPETRSQTCVAPLIGSWSQQTVWTSVPAPACWAQTWMPLTAPAGVCATPALPVTAGPLSYFTAGSVMTSVGYVAAGLPCGPETKTVGSVKFCRITKAQTDLIGWPVPLAATDLWARVK